MKIMVSACLLGENCKYNGGNNLNKKVIDFISEHIVIPICPEVFGGLSIPREPCELVDGVAKTKEGISCDKEYREGANKALEIAKKENPDLIILQSRSPSCGVKEIYDGTFTKTKINGQGVFAKLAIKEGYKVIDVEDL